MKNEQINDILCHRTMSERTVIIFIEGMVYEVLITAGYKIK